MDANRLTQKSQQALTEAQTLATRLGHTETDGDHLLAALLDQEGGLVPRLFESAGANRELFGAEKLQSATAEPRYGLRTHSTSTLQRWPSNRRSGNEKRRGPWAPSVVPQHLEAGQAFGRRVRELLVVQRAPAVSTNARPSSANAGSATLELEVRPALPVFGAAGEAAAATAAATVKVTEPRVSQATWVT
jgi:hypothetical protein